MRNARKNDRRMWYALYDGKKMVYDSDGRPTLEYTEGYSSPVEFYANLSAGSSDADEQPFGQNVQYDRIILTHDMSCPINEHSLIWVHKEPETDVYGQADPKTADYEVTAAPLDSLNVIRIAIKRRTGWEQR